jgi:hypothetical protein
MSEYELKSIKTIRCTDDFIRLDIHVGETVKYNGKYYTFSGISGYECDLKNPLNMLREIPFKNIVADNPYIGNRFIYNGYEVEVLQQNKNGTYSIQAYDKKGKKYGGRFSILARDTVNLKPIPT